MHDLVGARYRIARAPPRDPPSMLEQALALVVRQLIRAQSGADASAKRRGCLQLPSLKKRGIEGRSPPFSAVRVRRESPSNSPCSKGEDQKPKPAATPGNASDFPPLKKGDRGGIVCFCPPRPSQPLAAANASVSAGTTSCRSPTTPYLATLKIGAEGSLLIATMQFEPFMPTRC